METINGFPVLTVEYGKSGKAKDSAHTQKVKDFAAAQDLDELLVLSHGWNNAASEAKDLYTKLLRHVKDNLSAEPRLAARKIGVLAVIWPSKRFRAFETDTGGGHAGGAASAEPEIDDPLEDARALAAELDEELSEAQQTRLIDAAEAAIKNENNWAAFLETLKEVIPHDEGDGDEADMLLFDGIADPDQALAQFDGIDAATDDGYQGGGAASGLFSGAAGAVGSVLNFTTYYTMKRRAGKVGQFGLAHSLVGLRVQKPSLRIHFAGHSFGGRVVTMAAMALNGQSSAAPDSMTLLQAAFSQNAFSANFPPPNKPGFFRNVMARNCVKGPILVTHTFNDIPVRVAYSIASALSGDNASFTSNAPSQYGGLGANGAQHMGSEGDQGMLLEAGAAGYAFRTGTVYNLKADQFIKGHSKIKTPQVGYALVKAMAATL
ncbi:MAG: hypothetical protein AAF999_06780 [Pseudomonadota bacterium]